MNTLPVPRITRYREWLAAEHGLRFADYEAFWRWSTNELDTFWGSLWRWFEIESPTPHRAVLADARMPGAVWFPGAQVNFARQALRHGDHAHAAGHPAVVFQSERMATPAELPWPELQRQVAVFAARLREAGVARGDRVCAILPNRPEAIVAFLATASLGAIWSICSPDMGPVAVLDRFRQIEPKVLVAVDGQVWGGIANDRRAVLHEVLAGLPSAQHLVFWADVDAAAPAADFAAPGRTVHRFDDWTAGDAPAGWQPEWLPFDHPLWIVYSSGTTGLPKPIVHGHGGVMLEMLKGGALHNDVAPSVEFGERFHWFSSTGWIMWNAQLGALLSGTTVCLYDGNPAGHSTPQSAGRPTGACCGALWRRRVSPGSGPARPSTPAA
jgi:acetoacetyl-CoA synthetase